MRRLLVAMVAAVVALVMVMVPSVAAAGQDRFGLTSEQATGLQAKVDGYLAKLGGRQVAPNKIELAGGAFLAVAVPGETAPRSLDGVAIPECTPRAKYKWFCAYELEYFRGDQIGMYDCGRYYRMPWVTDGSWENNQTSGTRPRVYFDGGNHWDMPPAHSLQETGVDWGPVTYIVPCWH